ncbi:GNAT family N-acetyltransferase [Gorillibacterium sp. sgz5001074]|uniref:GNAT family N-acetyltransferase n=1 Tax=Gorillibacterium sp. sgz5001074 TaxID=3446695 RepID=UPI003F67790B
MSNGGRIYENELLQQVPWADTEDGRSMRTYFEPFLEHPSRTLIHNIRTRFAFLSLGSQVLPLTVNETEWDNAYVCSPYTHYVRYAHEELERLKNRPLELLLGGILKGIGSGMRAVKLNRVVHINNWLLSTNLAPSMDEDECREMTSCLLDRYPEHALVFRSLNRKLNGPIMDALIGMGYILVPSRQIYILDHLRHTPDAKARWLVKRDFGLMSKHGYSIVPPEEIMEEDIPRITELYRMLYLEKYSRCNPEFSPAFISHARETGSLRLYGLRRAGTLDAVLGFIVRDGVMTTPLFGYDLTLPQELGLYRMLSALLIRLAEESGRILHESSGAAQFKRNRGALPEIEYSAVYVRHLPQYRRLPWHILQVLLNRIGVPIIRKYKL